MKRTEQHHNLVLTTLPLPVTALVNKSRKKAKELIIHFQRSNCTIVFQTVSRSGVAFYNLVIPGQIKPIEAPEL